MLGVLGGDKNQGLNAWGGGVRGSHPNGRGEGWGGGGYLWRWVFFGLGGRALGVWFWGRSRGVGIDGSFCVVGGGG